MCIQQKLYRKSDARTSNIEIAAQKKMDQTMDSKKTKMQTPSRPIGLSRISPRTKLTPAVKRPNAATSQAANEQNASASKDKETDDSDLVTPTKRKKLALGRFVFNPKQTNDSININLKSESGSHIKTVDELKSEIAQMKIHLEKYEKYKADKCELNHLIAMWSQGGRTALEMLQEEIKPEQEIEQILTHLHLPSDVFD